MNKHFKLTCVLLVVALLAISLTASADYESAFARFKALQPAAAGEGEAAAATSEPASPEAGEAAAPTTASADAPAATPSRLPQVDQAKVQAAAAAKTAANIVSKVAAVASAPATGNTVSTPVEAAPPGEGSPADVAAKQGGENAEPDQFTAALNAVSQDILRNVRRIKRNEKWVKDVRELLEEYKRKADHVEAHNDKLRLATRELLRKKKQIENLRLQKGIEGQLNHATEDLATLQAALTRIRTRAASFTQTRNNLRETITQLSSQLGRLKGKPPVEKDAKKEAAVERAADETLDADGGL